MTTLAQLVYCDAEAVVSETSTGRNRPLVIRARIGDGEPVECVVKLACTTTDTMPGVLVERSTTGSPCNIL